MLKLRDYQKAAVDSLMPFWSAKKNHPIVVVPTGGGKSFIQAAMIDEFMKIDPSMRVLCLSHRKELTKQNSDELKGLLPAMEFKPSIGIFAASLKRRDWGCQVTFAQIQSVAKHLHKFDPFDVVFVDECHLIPRSSMTLYGQAVNMTGKMNPYRKIIGLTATPYRLDTGYLHKGEGAIFDGISYEIPVKKLIDDGYLAPVVSKRGQAKADLKGIKKRGGEYIESEMAKRFDIPELVQQACDEIMSYGAHRNAWLLFGANVEHCNHIYDYMFAHGVDARVIAGETTETERDQAVEDFKNGKLKCLINCNVLTTGFNTPICDLVAIVRATESTSLYVQIVGRGMRTYPGKTDCLLLDYGDNVARHGCIDDVQVKMKAGDGEGDAPVKICPECDSLVHTSSRQCPDCGFEFPKSDPNHNNLADSADALSYLAPPEELTVTNWSWQRHRKNGKPDSVRVIYHIGNLRRVSEWVAVDNPLAQRHVHSFFSEHSVTASSTDELLKLMVNAKMPKTITVRKKGKFEEVIGKSFTDKMELKDAG